MNDAFVPNTHCRCALGIPGSSPVHTPPKMDYSAVDGNDLCSPQIAVVSIISGMDAWILPAARRYFTTSPVTTSLFTGTINRRRPLFGRNKTRIRENLFAVCHAFCVLQLNALYIGPMTVIYCLKLLVELITVTGLNRLIAYKVAHLLVNHSKTTVLAILA